MASCYFLDIGREKWYSSREEDIALSILNVVFALVATLANSLVCIAIARTPSLKSPSNTLLLCLGTSDILLGLLVQPSFVLYRVFLHKDMTKACVVGLVFEITGWFLSAVTFFTLFAITFERYIALSHSMRYREIVTFRRVLVTFALIVFISAAVASSRLYLLNNKNLRIVNAVLIPSNTIALCCIYAKIFIMARKKQNETKTLNSSVRANLDKVEEKRQASMEFRQAAKSTITMALICGVFLLCYVPFFCTMVSFLIYGDTPVTTSAYNITLTFLFMNSAINPFLYCFRIKRIRKAVKRTLKEFVVWVKDDHYDVSSKSSSNM